MHAIIKQVHSLFCKEIPISLLMQSLENVIPYTMGVFPQWDWLQNFPFWASAEN